MCGESIRSPLSPPLPLLAAALGAVRQRQPPERERDPRLPDLAWGAPYAGWPCPAPPPPPRVRGKEYKERERGRQREGAIQEGALFPRLGTSPPSPPRKKNSKRFADPPTPTPTLSFCASPDPLPPLTCFSLPPPLFVRLAPPTSPPLTPAHILTPAPFPSPSSPSIARPRLRLVARSSPASLRSHRNFRLLLLPLRAGPQARVRGPRAGIESVGVPWI